MPLPIGTPRKPTAMSRFMRCPAAGDPAAEYCLRIGAACAFA
ncbi:MAG: hypothetical protein ACKVQT_30565 [Burkholderiales bacterium]